MKNMLRLAPAAIAAACLAAPVFAGPLTTESRKEIDSLLDVLTMHPAVGETQYFTMKAGEVISVPFNADATIEYYVNAVCDDDCSNVDLIAREADGVEADVDDFDDAAPTLNIHASEHRSPLVKPNGAPPRPMTIEIRMIACNSDVCSLGLKITNVESW